MEFVRLWTAAARHVYAYILTLVANDSDAEDLLQDVGLTAWEKYPESAPIDNFVAWACGIARYKVLGHLRAHRRATPLTESLLEQLSADAESMSDLLERQHEAVRECVKQLGERERFLLRLRYTSGFTVERVAAQAGCSLAACYKALPAHSRSAVPVRKSKTGSWVGRPSASLRSC